MKLEKWILRDTTVKSERKSARASENIEKVWRRDEHLINQTRSARDRTRRVAIRPISVHSISSGPTVVRIMRVQLKTSVKKIYIDKRKKKRGRKRVTMVVIYDRFVFFSVEKFFIPLLYSCLNILVQRYLRECMCMWSVSVYLHARVRVCCL